MTQKLLNQEKERIKNSQKDLPLYKAIRSCIMAYLSKMRHIQPCPEEVLIDVVRILDDIKADPKNAHTICRERWDELELEYRQITNYEEKADAEISNLVGIELYTTALLLMWYDGESAIFYHTLAEILCNTVAIKIQDFSTRFKPLREKIINQSEALTDWISDYMISDEFLSEELLGTENFVSNQDYGFDRDKIKSLVTADPKDIIADILIDNMAKYVGKNSPKQALLPIYCAIYEINWIAQRPEYDDFVAAFPGILKNPTSYKDYVPTVKGNSNYLQPSCKGINIENMCESLQSLLNERIKPPKGQQKSLLKFSNF